MDATGSANDTFHAGLMGVLADSTEAGVTGSSSGRQSMFIISTSVAYVQAMRDAATQTEFIMPTDLNFWERKVVEAVLDPQIKTVQWTTDSSKTLINLAVTSQEMFAHPEYFEVPAFMPAVETNGLVYRMPLIGEHLTLCVDHALLREVQDVWFDEESATDVREWIEAHGEGEVQVAVHEQDLNECYLVETTDGETVWAYFSQDEDSNPAVHIKHPMFGDEAVYMQTYYFNRDEVFVTAVIEGKMPTNVRCLYAGDDRV
jgi:hypothetical protein